LCLNFKKPYLVTGSKKSNQFTGSVGKTISTILQNENFRPVAVSTLSACAERNE
jgi:hypothetical protein